MANAGIFGPIAATKMAMEVSMELTWEDMPLFLLEHYRALDTSSIILVPGYRFIIFRRTGLRQFAISYTALKIKDFYMGLEV
jgi:hypothetical protein